MGTLFASVYNRFLGKITDDMYMVLTPHDTIKDLQNLLIDAIPGFEFPRKVLDYEILMRPINKDTANINGFFIEDAEGNGYEDASYFIVDLSSEEVNILATLMLGGWLQRQVTSIENTRMKYSGTDFKMTSQANHLSKLLTLLAEVQRQSKYLQRLYKRRRTGADGTVKSNWSVLREDSVINGYQEIDSLDMKDDTVKTIIFEGGLI